MTCIVAVLDKKRGSVIVGADSNASSGYDSVLRRDKKIFRNGPFVIGYTSSYRMGQLMQHVFEPPPVKGDLHKYMVRHFVESARSVLSAGGFSKKENNEESGGQFIVAYQDRIFTIHDDFQVSENAEPFTSVGCGQSFALGALRAMPKSVDPRKKCLEALRVAELSSGGVRAPFHLMRTTRGRE